MNKLKMEEGEAILCSSREEARAVLTIFHKLGYTWATGKLYLTGNDDVDFKHWRGKGSVVYEPIFGFRGNIESYQHRKVISSLDFLSRYISMEAIEDIKDKIDESPSEVIRIKHIENIALVNEDRIDLLERQLVLIKEYSNILLTRIELLEKTIKLNSYGN